MMLGVTEELFVLCRSHPDTYNLIGHVLFSLGGDGESFFEDISLLE